MSATADALASETAYLDETLAHELAHYQQFISSPFGLYLAIGDWNCVLSVCRSIQLALAEGEIDAISIPLVEYALDPGCPDLLGQNVLAAFIHKRKYQSWLLDQAPELDGLPLDQHAALLAEGLRQARCLTQLGVTHAEWTESTMVPGLPSQGLTLPSWAGREVTTRDLLENAATGSSAIVLVDPAADWSDFSALLDQKPDRYTYLIRHAARSFCDDLIPFRARFREACDLALFGPWLPTMPSYGSPSVNWTDLHPAWRLVRILDFCEAAPRAWLHDDPIQFANQVSVGLGWPKFEDCLSQLDVAPLAALGEPFDWLANEFATTIRYRREGQRFLGPVLGGLLGLRTAAGTFDPEDDADFQAHALKHVESSPAPPGSNHHCGLRATRRATRQLKTRAPDVAFGTRDVLDIGVY